MLNILINSNERKRIFMQLLFNSTFATQNYQMVINIRFIDLIETVWKWVICKMLWENAIEKPSIVTSNGKYK